MNTYQRIGEEQGIALLTEEFITRMKKNPIFADTLSSETLSGHAYFGWPKILNQMVGGPSNFDYNALIAGHTKMKATKDQHRALLEDFSSAMQHLDFPTDIQFELNSKLANISDRMTLSV